MSASVPFIVHRISDAGAAEILGFDWPKTRDPATIEALKRTFREYPILAIRNMDMTPAEQADFSRNFGALDQDDPRPELSIPDQPDVLILSNEIRPDGKPVGVVDAGEEWHSDLSFRPVPAFATILQMIKRPSRGGDTEYCNLYLIYEALSEKRKAQLENLRALHHLSKLRNSRVKISANRPGAAEYYQKVNTDAGGTTHPIVRTHPETGRQALYISPRFTIAIEGMEDAEAQPLLDELFAMMEDKRFQYRHRWQDGDFVMWDNRCLNHRATGGYGMDDIRRLHRTCVIGEKPFHRSAS